MAKSTDKWRRTVSKITDGKLGSENVDCSEFRDGEENNEIEVENYFRCLKSKTNMKNLWVGKKFEDMIEGQRTPDISTDSDSEQLDLKMSRNLKNIQNIRLDSDEDEMRKDFVHQHIKSRDSESDDVINNLDNIHFAELEVNQLNLNDSSEDDAPKDFLPKIILTNIVGEEEESTMNSFQSGSQRVYSISELAEMDDDSKSINTCKTDNDIESIHSALIPPPSVKNPSKKYSIKSQKEQYGGIHVTLFFFSQKRQTWTYNELEKYFLAKKRHFNMSSM